MLWIFYFSSMVTIRFEERNKEHPQQFYLYILYIYFIDVSYRNTKTLLIYRDENKISYVSVWNWIKS